MTKIWKWYRDQDQSESVEISTGQAIDYLETRGYFKSGTVAQCVIDANLNNEIITLRTDFATYRICPTTYAEKPAPSDRENCLAETRLKRLDILEPYCNWDTMRPEARHTKARRARRLWKKIMDRQSEFENRYCYCLSVPGWLYWSGICNDSHSGAVIPPPKEK